MTSARFTRSLNSFIGGVNNGYAIVMRHNLRAPHWMRNCRTDKAYTETMELGHRVMSSFDSRIH